MIYRAAVKVLQTQRIFGSRRTLQKMKRKIWLGLRMRGQAGTVLPDEKILQKQRRTRFPGKLCISILTPLYNTPEPYLREMLRSVCEQTYPDWELCLCDASDESHAYVGKICADMQAKEPRIRYRRLQKNEGISGNTNECIRLATGDYMALLDHDDILHPSALFEAAKAIFKQGADFVYTDEAKFRKKTDHLFDPAFKPDFAKDDLRAHNYICHLTVYSRKLLDTVGLYDRTRDGSQDHDMVLRLTEKAKKIVHIPKILYFWRAHAGSVSTGTEVKPYATQAGIDGVEAQLRRQREPGSVHTISPYPSLYRIEYGIWGKPRISVIIYGEASGNAGRRCAESVKERTSYDPLELYILHKAENNPEIKAEDECFSGVTPLRAVRRDEQEEDGEALNRAVKDCSGEILFFLHAATELTSGDWAKEMLMYVLRKDTGAVGIKLYDRRKKIYSGGIALDAEAGSALHHMHRGIPWYDGGYEAALHHARNVSVLAGTGFMIKRQDFVSSGGFQNGMGPYCFADLCLRLRERGLLNVWTPFAAAAYRGPDPLRKADSRSFREKWEKKLQFGDPYYNPNVRKLGIF